LHLVLDLHLSHLLGDQLLVRRELRRLLEALDAIAGIAEDALDLVLVGGGLVADIARLLALRVEVVDDLGQLLHLPLDALHRLAAAGLGACEHEN